MWFKLAVSIITWLSGIAGFLHDRQQFKAGEINQVAREQNNAIQIMRAALKAPRIDTRDDLRNRLRERDF